MILHICAAAEWTGEVYTAPSLDEAGFIHCSDPGTAHLPATALYRGRTDLVLLEIDPRLLDVPVRWEPGDPPHPADIWFPHVYGPIRPEAVVAVHDFPPEPDGSFRLPPQVAKP
ncbi:DUF952 domain-containing protein [Amycolatopsis suaedae]|uniref:DUF952 domain-containing protein n=1 Tax=Amycolatopsis suaedae TaxID=2510978 RepID=A0A4V2ELM8_9PSEU|nr:DUF952 domain-containing protein [Amycolatopsis suaedae]RZQ62115.1 DUF952 domain-containing protein [Amycolatopsis suaedae]